MYITLVLRIIITTNNLNSGDLLQGRRSELDADLICAMRNNGVGKLFSLFTYKFGHQFPRVSKSTYFFRDFVYYVKMVLD